MSRFGMVKTRWLGYIFPKLDYFILKKNVLTLFVLKVPAEMDNSKTGLVRYSIVHCTYSLNTQ
jgi:hypothetical protein